MIRYIIEVHGGPNRYYLNDILHSKMYTTTEKLSAKRFLTEQLANEYMTKYLIPGRVVPLILNS